MPWGASEEEVAVDGNRQKKTKKLVKAYLLNEETLGELKFGVYVLGAPLEILTDHISVKSNVPFGRKWKETPITGALLNICEPGQYTCRRPMSEGDYEQ